MAASKKVQSSISKFFERKSAQPKHHKSIKRDNLSEGGPEDEDSVKIIEPRTENWSPDRDLNKQDDLKKNDKQEFTNEKTPWVWAEGKRHIAEDRSDAVSQSYPKSKKRKGLTPLEKQIDDFKEGNHDKLLLVQVGYKYKLFGNDAKVGASILNISFIEDINEYRFSYCSFPIFKLHINIKRLLAHGFKIGVVKQIESAIVKSTEKAQGYASDVMKRQLTGVYTRGTYMDNELGSSDTNVSEIEGNPRYIVCLKLDDRKKSFSLVAVQLATGDIVYDTHEEKNLHRIDDDLSIRLSQLLPSELLVIGERSREQEAQVKSFISNVESGEEVSVIYKQPCDHMEVTRSLIEYFDHINGGKSGNLGEYYTVNYSPAIQNCFLELIRYLSEFNLSTVLNIPENIKSFTDNKAHMFLSNETTRCLEIFNNYTDNESGRGTLISLLDHTRTRFGSRVIRSWIAKPLVCKNEIEERQHAVSELSSSFHNYIDSLKNKLGQIGKSIDLEELLIKVHYSSTQSSNANCASSISRSSIQAMLECFADILKMVKTFEQSSVSIESNTRSLLLKKILRDLRIASNSKTVFHFQKMINPSYSLGLYRELEEQKVNFFNRDYFDWNGISNEVKTIGEIEKNIEATLEEVRSYLKRPQLKFVTSRNEPYLIEIRNKESHSIPSDWVKVNGTATVSRFRGPKTTALLKELLFHKELLQLRCDEAFIDFLGKINEEYQYFRAITKNIALLDSLMSLTAASTVGPTVMPQMVEEQTINVIKSRNPIVENLLSSSGTYVPNDINIHYDSKRVLVITGPNMGGKSSYVKQIALIVIMAQIGCLVPCESATIGIFDSIFIRMGASDNIFRHESTFMREMSECSNIVKGLTPKSLVILDEIGRGTGTNDGISLAYSILRYFIEHEYKPLTLFITHYPSLHTLEHEYEGEVENFHMGYIEKQKSNREFPEIIFLYNFQKGVMSNSYGLNVAKLAGLPNSIIFEAHKVGEAMKKNAESSSNELLCLKFVDALKNLKNNKELSPDDIGKLLMGI